MSESRAGDKLIVLPPDSPFFDDFVIVKFLGQGGMGRVYQVKRQETDGPVLAAKVLLDSANLDHKELLETALLNELAVCMELPPHPNVVRSRFFRTSNGQVALFMDYVGGGDLETWIKQHKLPSLQQILGVAIQTGDGLAALHNNGVLHLDLKPLNILMTESGAPRISDFGLAHLFYRGPGGLQFQQASHPPIGTLQFCSPELAVASWGNQDLTQAGVGVNADIWSFGLIVLNLFRSPCNWIEGWKINDYRDGNGGWAHTAPFPKLPQALIKLLERCFELTPQHRWPSMDHVVSELRTIYRQEIEAEPPCPPRLDEPQFQSPGLAEGASGTLSHGAARRTVTGSAAEGWRGQRILDIIACDHEITKNKRQGTSRAPLEHIQLLTAKARLHSASGDGVGAAEVMSNAMVFIDRIAKTDTSIEFVLARTRLLVERALVITGVRGFWNNALEFTDKVLAAVMGTVCPLPEPERTESEAALKLNKAGLLWTDGKLTEAALLYEEVISLALAELLVGQATPPLCRAFLASCLNRGTLRGEQDRGAGAGPFVSAVKHLLTRWTSTFQQAGLQGDLATLYGALAVLILPVDAQEALTLADRGLELAEDLAYPQDSASWPTAREGLISATWYKGWIHFSLKHFAVAVELLSKNVALLEQLLNDTGRTRMPGDLLIARVLLAASYRGLFLTGDAADRVREFADTALRNLEAEAQHKKSDGWTQAHAWAKTVLSTSPPLIR